MRIPEEIERLWPAAQAHWSSYLQLSAPIHVEQSSIAQIDLNSRQISLNHRMIAERELFGSIEGLLAHEIGHHVRYPGTLAVDARLRIMERPLLPFESYSLINLFTDLLINQHLGQTLSEQLAAVYRAFSQVAKERDPVFSLYLAVYEELWRLEPGDLMGDGEPAFAEAHKGYRAEAQLLSQDLFHVGPNVYTQFLYFVSVLMKYVETPEEGEPQMMVVHECKRGDPSPDDWASALTPNAAEREAIEKALREGWISADEAERLGERLDARIAGIPGYGKADAELVPEVMAAYYRQQSERFLFRPPRQRLMGEAVTPTTLDEWEPGDAVKDVDWVATLVQRGDTLGRASPLVRAKVAEYEGLDVWMWQPRMEIYLDVSGSMPDPRFERNAMTLAAQILCASAIRAGGWVRAALYSGEVVPFWEWCRSEIEMSRFLMHYVGGGTEFPFALLEESVTETRREPPIRVVITDADFDSNLARVPDHRRILIEAIESSPALVLLLHMPDQERVREYEKLGARVVEVTEFDDFPRMATDLAFTLFPDGSGPGAPCP